MPEGLLLAVWSLIGLWVVVGLGWVEEIGPTANSVLYLTDYSGLSYTGCTRPKSAKINSSGIHCTSYSHLGVYLLFGMPIALITAAVSIDKNMTQDSHGERMNYKSY